MKSCATGLSARFFNVKSPIGCFVEGNSMGKALIPVCLAENLNACAGNMDKKWPVAKSLVRILCDKVITAPRGGSSPLS
jgi:hypothetical protein